MNDIELQQLWRSTDQKLEEARLLNMQSWALNMQCFKMLQQQKASSKLKRLISLKAFIAFLGVLWVAFLGFLIYHSLTWSNIFFVVSVGMIMLVTAIAIVVYIVHIVWIKQINNTDDVITTQQKLARLQSSTLWITRILFLQMPFHTTWFLRPQMFINIPAGWLIFQISITSLFTFFSVWLYRNISYSNMHKKWFRLLFSSSEWTSVVKAIDFVNEIEAFKLDRIK